MGSNKRYAEQIDRRVAARVVDMAAKPPEPHRPVHDWQPPWPPIRISTDEWIVMRDSKTEPVAVIRRVKLGPRNETFFRVVTWAEESTDRQLVGYFASFKEADQSMLFVPSQNTPRDRDPLGGHRAR